MQSIAKLSERDAGRIDAFHTRAGSDRRRAARSSCCARRRIRRGFWRRRRSAKPSTRSAPPTSCARLTLEQQRSLLDLFTRSAGEMLDERFESDLVKALLRIRRHRRQLCQPLRGGLGLCDAAPCVRRGERQEGRLGPRHRRHGRDHAGDGDGRARTRRRDRVRGRRARGDRRARPRCRRDPRQWRNHPRQICRLQRQPETAVYAAGARRMRCRRNFSPASSTGATAPAPSG